LAEPAGAPGRTDQESIMWCTAKAENTMHDPIGEPGPG
jgi:hypothetical protein